MSSTTGSTLKLSLFGQSHGAAIGVVIDGLSAGERVHEEKLQAFMERRAPGRNKHSTPRKEADAVRIVSGLVDGVTCGAPLCALIENTDTRSGDYASLADRPRPGHADWAAQMRYGGHQDVRGGGHFSGRLTAPLCAAGGIALQILERRGIQIGAHIHAIAGIPDTPFEPVHLTPDMLHSAAEKPFPVLDDEAGTRMQDAIRQAAGDSVGGVVECGVLGMPGGIGDPMFGGMENRLSAMLFGIPAVRGVEFGAGFKAAEMLGSEHNDSIRIHQGRIVTDTNHHGGILGGITTGMPILFRVAFKPTPSIAKEQKTISFSQMEEVTLAVRGRHDPCIVPRAVPCVESAAALVMLDSLL